MRTATIEEQQVFKRDFGPVSDSCTKAIVDEFTDSFVGYILVTEHGLDDCGVACGESAGWPASLRHLMGVAYDEEGGRHYSAVALEERSAVGTFLPKIAYALAGARQGVGHKREETFRFPYVKLDSKVEQALRDLVAKRECGNA